MKLHTTTNLYQWNACGRGFSDTRSYVRPNMLVLVSLRLFSSVPRAIRFLLQDFTCFMAETVLQTSSAFFVRNLLLWEACVILFLTKITYRNIHNKKYWEISRANFICKLHVACGPVVGRHWHSPHRPKIIKVPSPNLAEYHIQFSENWMNNCLVYGRAELNKFQKEFCLPPMP